MSHQRILMSNLMRSVFRSWRVSLRNLRVECNDPNLCYCAVWVPAGRRCAACHLRCCRLLFRVSGNGSARQVSPYLVTAPDDVESSKRLLRSQAGTNEDRGVVESAALTKLGQVVSQSRGVQEGLRQLQVAERYVVRRTRGLAFERQIPDTTT